MLNIPRLALFPADMELLAVIQSHLANEHYSLRSVRSVREVIELIDDEQDTFDAILLPCPLALNIEISELSALIRASERLCATPIVGVFAGELREDLFSAGCDMCLELPCPAELLHLQLSALGRFHRQLEARIVRAFEAAGLRRSTIAAFNACSQALILCDRDLGISFANTRARELCGFSDPALKEEYASLQQQLRSELSLDIDQSSVRKIVLRRPQGSEWEATITMVAIELDASTEAGFCLALADSSIERQLSGLRAFSDRVRNLALLSLGTLIASLPEGAVSTPLDAILELRNHEVPHTGFDSLLAGLIQVLDSLLDVGVSLKVLVQPGIVLRHRQSDVVALFSELILSAQQYLAGSGHLKLSSRLYDTSQTEFNLEITPIAQDRDQSSEVAQLLRFARGFERNGQLFSGLQNLLRDNATSFQISQPDMIGAVSIRFCLSTLNERSSD